MDRVFANWVGREAPGGTSARILFKRGIRIVGSKRVRELQSFLETTGRERGASTPDAHSTQSGGGEEEGMQPKPAYPTGRKAP